MIRQIVAVALSLAVLGACAQTPQQAVYEAKSSYVATGKTVLACAAISGSPCASDTGKAAIKKADTAAFATIDAAETTVRTPGVTDSAISFAVAAVTNAVKAFVEIVSALGGK